MKETIVECLTALQHLLSRGDDRCCRHLVDKMLSYEQGSEPSRWHHDRTDPELLSIERHLLPPLSVTQYKDHTVARLCVSPEVVEWHRIPYDGSPLVMLSYMGFCKVLHPERVPGVDGLYVDILSDNQYVLLLLDQENRSWKLAEIGSGAFVAARWCDDDAILLKSLYVISDNVTDTELESMPFLHPIINELRWSPYRSVEWMLGTRLLSMMQDLDDLNDDQKRAFDDLLEHQRIADLMFAQRTKYRSHNGSLYCTLSSPVMIKGSAREELYVVFQALHGEMDVSCCRESEFHGMLADGSTKRFTQLEEPQLWFQIVYWKLLNKIKSSDDHRITYTMTKDGLVQNE
jgi:hypothetical protein